MVRLPLLFLGVHSLLAAQADSCNRIECLPPNLQRLAVKYRNAVAEVLGLPPEAIREDVVVKWVKHWMEAYVKPEYQHMLRALIYTTEPTIVGTAGKGRPGVIY